MFLELMGFGHAMGGRVASELESKFLAERDELLRLSIFGELEETYESARKRLEERYKASGFSEKEIAEINACNKWVYFLN